MSRPPHIQQRDPSSSRPRSVVTAPQVAHVQVEAVGVLGIGDPLGALVGVVVVSLEGRRERGIFADNRNGR